MGAEREASEKAVLRARFRAERQARSAAEQAGLAEAIAARVLSLPEVRAARTVLVFWPAVVRGEVDTRPIVAALLDQGVVVALPVVVPGPVPRMDARRFTAEADLADGPWGLREPTAAAAHVSPDAIDVVVVPALAAGRDGSRLGYGGGYYDAYLPLTPALRVGVVPHAALLSALPTEPHDARLDVAVTERETVRTGRNCAPVWP